MSASTEHLLNNIRQLQKNLPAPDQPWLNTFREAGLSRFAEAGLPTRKTEAWKYTNVKPLAENNYWQNAPATSEADTYTAKSYLFEGTSNPRLVFVNGRYTQTLSNIPVLENGVIIEPLENALKNRPGLVREHLGKAVSEAHPFAAINAGLIANGLFVFIPPSVVLNEPIHVLLLNTEQTTRFSAHPRILIAAGNHSTAEIITHEAAIGNVDAFNNCVTEFVLEAGAQIKHSKLQTGGNTGINLSGCYVQQARDSRFESHTISLGGRLLRNDLNVKFTEPGASCSLNGLYIGCNAQHIDNHTTIEHAAPYCDSHEYYKGLIADQAHAVFNGRIHIHPDAQKSNADMQNKNLLLSAKAEIDTKPELEIYADDVKCSHGATVGQLDSKQLFYLQTRGMNPQAAAQMLSAAFLGELLEQLPSESLRQKATKLVESRLHEITQRPVR